MNQTNRFSQLVTRLALVALGMASQGAHALTTWSQTGCVWSGDTHGNLCTINSGADKVNVTAFSTTDVSPAGAWETATLMSYSGGFGVINRGTNDPGEGSSPEHAIDNNGGAGGYVTDALLFTFEESTILRNLKIGWKSGDADVSVLRYTGQLTPVLGDKTPGGLLSAGWEVVGNYSNLSTSSARNINGSEKASSWWLVTAYNTTFGNSWTMGDDNFKLLSVAGDRAPPSSDTPEPATLALAGLAVFGMGVARRRSKKA